MLSNPLCFPFLLFYMKLLLTYVDTILCGYYEMNSF